MSLEIITFDSQGGTPLVATSLAQYGVRCAILGQGIRKWRYSYKIDLALELLPSVTSEYVLVCDAYDVLFLDHPDVVLKKYLAFGCAMLLNADKKLWPRATESDMEFRQLYDSLSDSPFRYLNSGCYIGRREFLVDFLTMAQRAPDHPRFPGDDQAQFHHAFRAMHGLGVRLDTRCELFQVTNAVRARELQREGNGKLRNLVFDTTPAIIHANKNGRTNIFGELRDSLLSGNQ